jgi:ribonucleoside-diphosphate reductase alpha chain
MVKNPFSEYASLKIDRIGEVSKIAMRFLDNVLDETHYPISEQRMESMNKRRTGLGITGLGNMLQQLGIRYGSETAVITTRLVMEKIRNSAYLASIDLALERGQFPLFDVDKYMQGKFIKRLPIPIRDEISSRIGIRNSVLLTIAPTGTTSIYYGNVSSGLEPTFAWRYNRKMRQADGSFKEFEQVEDYGYRLYKEVKNLTDRDDEEIIKEMPDYMVTTNDLTVQDHLNMQATCQEYVDASISKTINCPKEITFENFKDVYITAYDMKLKGCTTYHPSEILEKVRGSILSVATPKDQPQLSPIIKRPTELSGKTYKTKWQEHAYYITINNCIDEHGYSRPFEVFINTKDASHQEWIMALTRSISAIFRRGGDFMFIIKELQEVHSSLGGAWVGKKYVPSLVALIGSVLEDHLTKYHNDILGRNLKVQLSDKISHLKIGIENSGKVTVLADDSSENIVGEQCPQCQAPALISKEGCQTCLSCNFSNCG